MPTNIINYLVSILQKAFNFLFKHCWTSVKTKDTKRHYWLLACPLLQILIKKTQSNPIIINRYKPVSHSSRKDALVKAPLFNRKASRKMLSIPANCLQAVRCTWSALTFGIGAGEIKKKSSSSSSSIVQTDHCKNQIISQISH